MCTTFAPHCICSKLRQNIGPHIDNVAVVRSTTESKSQSKNLHLRHDSLYKRTLKSLHAPRSHVCHVLGSTVNLQAACF